MKEGITLQAKKAKPQIPAKDSAANALQVTALMLLIFLITIIYTSYWECARDYPYSIEYEGHVLWACLRLAQGANIYDPGTLHQEPWSVIIYNPLYFAFGAGLVKLFGACFEWLRIISMESALLCFFSFGALLKRCKLNDFITILTIALFACSDHVLKWSSVARVDFFGLALAILALERFTKAYLKTKGYAPSLMQCLALSAGAVFCKQQYIVFPIAFILSALFCRRQRLGIIYALAFSSLSAIIICMLQLSTGGYWAHLTYAAGLPWEWSTLSQFILPFFQDPKTVAACAIIILGRSMDGEKLLQKVPEYADSGETTGNAISEKQALEALALTLLVVSFTPVLYTMGLRGAYHNHLLCTEFALMWLTAMNLAKLPASASTVTLLAAALSLQNLLLLRVELGQRTIALPETAKAVKLISAVSRGKRILSEDPSVAIFAGAEPAIVDATTIMNMSSKNPQDSEDLLSSLKQRKYAAVIVNAHDAEKRRNFIWTSSLLNELEKYYRRSGECRGNGVKQVIFLPSDLNKSATDKACNHQEQPAKIMSGNRVQKI